MMLKRQARKPPQQQHMHYVITCGNVQCRSQFPICGAAGVPCFVICPVCHVTNKLGGAHNA